MRPPPADGGKNDEIIDVEEWRVVGDEERPNVEPLPALRERERLPAEQQEVIWIGGPTTVVGGRGCCLGFSTTILVIVVIFILGLVAACWLIATLLGWALPFV
jgi:hypothetical protein